MLKLKLQYFGHLLQRADSLEKNLMLGRTEGGEWDNRWWSGWMASPTQWTWVWVGSRSWWWTGRPGVLQSTGLQRVRHDQVTELNPWVHYATAVKLFKSYFLGTREYPWRQNSWLEISPFRKAESSGNVIPTLWVEAALKISRFLISICSSAVLKLLISPMDWNLGVPWCQTVKQEFEPKPRSYK